MTKTKIYIIDEDRSNGEKLKKLFNLDGYDAFLFDDDDALFKGRKRYGDHPLLLDSDAPGKPGLDILDDLKPAHYRAPIFMTSTTHNASLIVAAIKAGAYDFIEKPTQYNEIRTRLEAATEKFQIAESNYPGAKALTPREKEVLKLIASGQSNKQASLNLDLSPRTVEVHRAHIMGKLGAKNAADLVRIVMGG